MDKFSGEILSKISGSLECGICLGLLQNPQILICFPCNCKNIYCNTCAFKFIKNSNYVFRCPKCKSQMECNSKISVPDYSARAAIEILSSSEYSSKHESGISRQANAEDEGRSETEMKLK